MLPLANAVPLSDDGWLVVLWVTVAACVVWLAATALVIRRRLVHGPGPDVQPSRPREPRLAARLGARTVLTIAVALAVLVVVVFLVGRVGDLLS